MRLAEKLHLQLKKVNIVCPVFMISTDVLAIQMVQLKKKKELVQNFTFTLICMFSWSKTLWKISHFINFTVNAGVFNMKKLCFSLFSTFLQLNNTHLLHKIATWFSMTSAKKTKENCMLCYKSHKWRISVTHSTILSLTKGKFSNETHILLKHLWLFLLTIRKNFLRTNTAGCIESCGQFYMYQASRSAVNLPVSAAQTHPRLVWPDRST